MHDRALAEQLGARAWEYAAAMSWPAAVRRLLVAP
jgi:hypothetical protein